MMGKAASHTTAGAAGSALDATDNIPPPALTTPGGCREKASPLDLHEM